MRVDDAVRAPPRPAEFARLLLNALDLSAAGSRRRKRDQKPDEVGPSLKRALLERILADDPDPEVFGDWLLDEVLNATATGPRRATGAQILDEYRLAAADPAYTHWLSHAGAHATGAGEHSGCR